MATTTTTTDGEDEQQEMASVQLSLAVLWGGCESSKVAYPRMVVDLLAHLLTEAGPLEILLALSVYLGLGLLVAFGLVGHVAEFWIAVISAFWKRCGTVETYLDGACRAPPPSPVQQADPHNRS